jgi:predicted MFS family arabinose efflux permease
VLEQGSDSRVSRRAWHVLGVAVVAQLGFSIIEQGVPTLTGFIKDDLGISAAAAGLVVSSFAFGKILGSYAAGVLADRMGERLVLVGGGLLTGVLLAVAMASPLPALLALLVVAGITSAGATPAGGRLVLLAFPRNRRGLALGIRHTGVPIGGVVGAVLLPWLAHSAGWRWALAAAGVILAVAVLPLAHSRAGGRGPKRVDLGPQPKGFDRNVKLLTLWACILVTGQFAVIAFLALDMHQGAGLSLPKASLLVAVAQAAGIAGRVLWGAFSDRTVAHGRKPQLLALTGVCLLAVLVLFAIPRSVPTGALVAVAAFVGFALMGYQALWLAVLAEIAGADRVGAATGFAVTFVIAAAALSTPLYGLVADITGTYRAMWAVLAGVLALAFIPAALLQEPAVQA